MTPLTPWTDSLATAVEYLSSIDPILADVITRIGPCTLVPDPNTFETLVDAIVSQQISVKAADAIVARLRAALPDKLITPESIILLNHDTLRGVGLSASKARYIRDLTERVVSGQLVLAELDQMEDEEIITKLTEVKGIGRWTAEMILMFSLGRLDVLPVDDLGFVESVRTVYGLEERPKRKEMIERGEAWKPYRSIATWYMWRIRENAQQNGRPKTRIVSL